MENRWCFIFISIFLYNVNAQHRSPPGVNPHQYQDQGNVQYQQPPPPQYQQGAPGVPQGQYQGQQQQYQGQQQQQQQYQPPPPPPQQQQPQYQQPNPQQHPPPQGGGHQHEHQQQQQRVLHNNNMQEERDHIKDHLEVPLDTSGMSEDELQYHYFKMHDADNNNKLDGQELIKSLFHWHDASNHDAASPAHAPPAPKIFTDEELVNMIDPILEQDDRNRDGFIDYGEFVQAQRKAAAANAAAAAASASQPAT